MFTVPLYIQFYGMVTRQGIGVLKIFVSEIFDKRYLSSVGVTGCIDLVSSMLFRDRVLGRG